MTNKHIYEAMLTGPQQMPVFSDGVIKPDEKRDIIAYLNKVESDPGYGGASLGALGPVSEGLTAWLVGLGARFGFAVLPAAMSACISSMSCCVRFRTGFLPISGLT